MWRCERQCQHDDHDDGDYDRGRKGIAKLIDSDSGGSGGGNGSVKGGGGGGSGSGSRVVVLVVEVGSIQGIAAMIDTINLFYKSHL